MRLLYNLDRRPPGAVAPPPPKTRPDEIEALPIATCAVPGWPDLMHHKYVVRDAASVWTGSTNWTDDSWSREENVIAVVDSPAVAAPLHRGLRAAVADEATFAARAGVVEPP